MANLQYSEFLRPLEVFQNIYGMAKNIFTEGAGDENVDKTLSSWLDIRRLGEEEEQKAIDHIIEVCQSMQTVQYNSDILVLKLEALTRDTLDNIAIEANMSTILEQFHERAQIIQSGLTDTCNKYNEVVNSLIKLQGDYKNLREMYTRKSEQFKFETNAQLLILENTWRSTYRNFAFCAFAPGLTIILMTVGLTEPSITSQFHAASAFSAIAILVNGAQHLKTAENFNATLELQNQFTEASAEKQTNIQDFLDYLKGLENDLKNELFPMMDLTHGKDGLESLKYAGEFLKKELDESADNDRLKNRFIQRLQCISEECKNVKSLKAKISTCTLEAITLPEESSSDDN